jgi:hypothetical protein
VRKVLAGAGFRNVAEGEESDRNNPLHGKGGDRSRAKEILEAMKAETGKVDEARLLELPKAG